MSHAASRVVRSHVTSCSMFSVLSSDLRLRVRRDDRVLATKKVLEPAAGR